MFVTPRYANRSSTTDDHRSATAGCPNRHGRQNQDRGIFGEKAPTRADGILVKRNAGLLQASLGSIKLKIARL